MIEAPEARILCRQLNETVRGKKITDVYTQFSPHKFAWFIPVEQKTIDHAQSQGGMVEITIGDKVLILTDGVNLRYLAPGSKLPAKHQLLIAFEDESCLVASVTRQRCFAGYPLPYTYPPEEKNKRTDRQRARKFVLSDKRDDE